MLFAEVNGDPVATIEVTDGRTVTDPEHATLALKTRLHVKRSFAWIVLSDLGTVTSVPSDRECA